MIGLMSEAVDAYGHLLARLEGSDPRKRVNALNALAVEPVADERLLAACEKLLEDQTVTILSLLYQFGEVRWAAADAVAAIRQTLGRTDPVLIENVMSPIDTAGIVRLADAVGITRDGTGVEPLIATLTALAAANAVPRRTITR